MTGSTLQRLQAWYLSECNEDWEHQYGVTIDTLDNPGWPMTIDLIETSMEGRVTPGSRIDRTESDWVQFESDGKKFQAAGGALNLEEMIESFLAWVSLDQDHVA